MLGGGCVRPVSHVLLSHQAAQELCEGNNSESLRVSGCLLASWVTEVCGAVGYEYVCQELWGYRGGCSASGTAQFMVYAGLGCSHSCISSCWRKRLRVGGAYLVQEAGEKAVTRG